MNLNAIMVVMNHPHSIDWLSLCTNMPVYFIMEMAFHMFLQTDKFAQAYSFYVE
jgi:hypothetical protein